MFSKSSRKPCQVDVKIDPNLDFEVGVVQAFLGVEVEGGVEDDVTIEDPPGIEVSGVDVQLGISVVKVGVKVEGGVDDDVTIEDPPCIGDIDVGGNIDVDMLAATLMLADIDVGSD